MFCHFWRKFKMAAIFGEGKIFLKIAKSTFIRYPVGRKFRRNRSISHGLGDMSTFAFFSIQNSQLLIISRPACRSEIIICTMCVCTCVRACVTQFSLKLLQLHIFGKLQVLMNSFALQYFWGLVNVGLLLSE